MSDNTRDRASEVWLREALEIMSDGFALYDPEGRLEFFNESFRRIHEYSDAELAPDVATYDTLGQVDEAQASNARKPLTFAQRLAQLQRDGTNVVVQFHGDRVYERHQSATPSGGMISLLTDITDLKRAEDALRQALDLADQASQAKSEFLATMSHEIRTPIAGVLGLADIVLDEDLYDETLSEARRDNVLKIKRAGQSLITILSDILDISKIQAGMTEIEAADFDLHGLITESLDIFYPKAGEKGISLGSKVSPDLPTAINGDPTRIRQVLVNLIGNAIKFTEQGSITLGVGCSAQGDGELYLRFEVIDTGIGIARDQHDRLFEDFTQVDSSTTRKYEGTGLGLSISRRLTELMGGDIGFDSIVGEGSTFWFTVRGRPAKTEARNTAKTHSEDKYRATRPLHILLAEDNDMNQMIITAVLTKFDHRVTAVDNGLAAVEAVRHGEFDLVLMDIRMPEMDGPEATRVIRREAGAKATIPIIAVTADALIENRDDCFDAGMNGYITKPIDLSELVNAINGALDEEIHIPI